MKKLTQKLRTAVVTILLAVLLILLVSSLPSLFSYGRPSINQLYSNSEDPDFKGRLLYKIHFHPDKLWKKPLLYLKQVKNGKIFTYSEGKTVRNYLKQAPRYFKVSFMYICAAGILSLIIGTFFSLYMSDKKRNPVFYEFLSFMTIFPDFILIFFIQFLFFFINKAAGGIIVRTYTPSASDRAVLLPLFVMALYPSLYIVRSIGNQLKDINNEPYISLAHAKGLSAGFIKYFHIGPAAIKFLKGDIHKLLAILFSNLFITELMFNNKGLTSFLFNNIHQYSATVNTITMILLMYLLVYICLQAFLHIAGRILGREKL